MPYATDQMLLSNRSIPKAKDQADILIDQSGYSLVMGGSGLGSFGTWIPGGEPETWPITRNVIWDLHRSENKLNPQNTEVIMAMPNRGLASESFRQWLQMRIYGPYWNSGSIQTPDGKQAGQNYPRTNANYNTELDLVRGIGRGIGVSPPHIYFAQHSLWYVNGVNDDGDLRHRSDVGNWVRMTDLKYNDPSSGYYGQNFMLYHPETGRILCSDTVRCWYDWPHYKYWNLDVGMKPILTRTSSTAQRVAQQAAMAISICIVLLKPFCFVLKPNSIWETMPEPLPM